MSLKARVDKLSRELAFGEMFDGATMEEISACVFDDRPARPGVRRAVAYQAIRSIAFDLSDPEQAAEARVEHGIAEDATAEEIRQRLLELATEAGLTGKEMKSLSEAI